MKEFEYVVQHLALLSGFQLPPEEAGMPTFCTKLFHNLQPVEGVVPPATFAQHFPAVADGVPGAELLLPVERCFAAGASMGRRGVPLSLGDTLWPLITLILVGLQRAGDMRRKTEASWAALAQQRTNSENNLFGSLITNVGNALASAYQSTGLDHLGEAIGEDFHSVWTPFQANVLAPIKRDIASPFQGLQTKSWRNTFTFPGCEDPETGKRQEVQFTEFNGKAFWDIRDHYGMDEDAYQKSLGLQELITGLIFGGLNSPRRLSSSGKSASFFFMTHDSQIIMKTLPRKEAQTLCQMLVKYRDYILSQGDTLLTIYLGLYEICIGEQKTLFVTMLNVFPPSVQVRMQYDLKDNVALKDLDFHQQKTFLVIDAAWQQSLYEQIVRDAEYLQSEGLNDYSLLLGIAGDYSGPVPSQSSTDPATPAGPAARAGPAAPACKASRKFYNGIPDVDNTEMYYVGIIDILTAFEGVKVVEHAMKSVYQKNFSCIPPNNYAKRFVAFMEAILCSRTVEKLYFVTTGEWATFERISTVLGNAPPTVSVLDPRLASPLRIPGSPTSHPVHGLGEEDGEDGWAPADGDDKGKGQQPPEQNEQS